jgi:two-component system phosphate regulon sensor histidine kinase PhoR
VNWSFNLPTILLLAISFLLIWWLVRLLHRLKAYTLTVRRAGETVTPKDHLPMDVPGLEELSNAVRSLAGAMQFQTATIEAARDELAAVLERMTDGVLIANGEGRITFLNPAAGRLFGMQNGIGHTVAEVVRHHQMVEAWQRSLESGQEQSAAVELRGHRQFLQLFVLPDQETGGSLLLLQDLTRVRQLESVRRDFISNVSHELRTPLASLKALAETLRDGALEDPPAARRFLGRIETEVDALTQMAQELLELTRIESGQVPLELKEIDPQKLLNSAADRMKAQAERAGLALKVEIPARLPAIQADGPRLEQVLVNLIHNAVKFTLAGGQVVLSAIVDGDFICFSVQDTGVGIPSDDLGRIFERFYKADRARSSGGTGLGLSISRHIVEAHGGKIWAESLEGRGSTFYFIIPVNQTITNS